MNKLKEYIKNTQTQSNSQEWFSQEWFEKGVVDKQPPSLRTFLTAQKAILIYSVLQNLLQR